MPITQLNKIVQIWLINESKAKCMRLNTVWSDKKKKNPLSMPKFKLYKENQQFFFQKVASIDEEWCFKMTVKFCSRKSLFIANVNISKNLLNFENKISSVCLARRLPKNFGLHIIIAVSSFKYKQNPIIGSSTFILDQK